MKPVWHAAFDALTPAAAYWVGFLMADGCLLGKKSRSSGGKVYEYRLIGLELSQTDLGHVKKFRKFVRGDTLNIYNFSQVTNYGPKSASRILVNSPRMFDRLCRLGMTPRKTGSETCPPELAHSPDFWRGMIDGDGSVGLTRNRRWFYPSIRLDSTESVMLAFVRFAAWAGILTTAPRQSPSGLWHAGLNGTPARQLIQAVYYPGHPVSLARKWRAAKKCLAWTPIRPKVTP